MKAIGIKDIHIKGVYLIKYFAIAIIGGSVGYLLSIPFSNQMIAMIATHIKMTKGNTALGLSVGSVILIVFVTMEFCYICTSKIGKLSAIDAIRQGSNGERFKKSKSISVHKLKGIKPTTTMAINDIVSSFSKYSMLIITFILGTIIILIPVNMLNTLQSEDTITMFGITNSDFVITGTFAQLENIQSKGSTIKEELAKQPT